MMFSGTLAGAKIASYECDKFADERLVRVVALAHQLQVEDSTNNESSDLMIDLTTAYYLQYNEEILPLDVSSCLQTYKAEVDR